MEKRESDVEREIVRYAEATGWFQAKIAKSSKRGIPDRVFIKSGFVLWMEIKRPGEKPSSQQIIRMKEMRRYGAYTCWVDNVDAAKEWLDLF